MCAAAPQVTVGIDFVSRFVYLKDQVVRLQLWDTAGQEKFRALIPAYIRNSRVAIVTYDVTGEFGAAHRAACAGDNRLTRVSWTLRRPKIV